MKRIAFYCQHLRGVGHLARPLNICRRLAERHEVHLFQGGPKVELSFTHPNFHHHFLPPLLMVEETKQLYPVEPGASLDSVWPRRRAVLQQAAESKFDCLITESFPFGRNNFTTEVLAFISGCRTHNRKLQVFCSVRDIINDRFAESAIDVINQHYDCVMVHGDPEFVGLEETFPQLDRIRSKLLYTGYVCESKKGKNGKNGASRRIVVSSGSGMLGHRLYRSALELSSRLNDFNFLFLLGPHIEDQTLTMLAEARRRNNNVAVEPFSDHFEDLLLDSSCSISMGGYNTTMNLLNTQTKAVVLPYNGDIEQPMRADRLAEKGCIQVVDPDQLSAERLGQKVCTALTDSYPDISIDLNGAEKTLEIISEHQSA